MWKRAWRPLVAIGLVCLPALSLPGVHGELLKSVAWSDQESCVEHDSNGGVYVARCHGWGNQQWWLTETGQLRSDAGKCLEFADHPVNTVSVADCDESKLQQWYTDGGLIKPQGFERNDKTMYMRHGMCVSAASDNKRLSLKPCVGNVHHYFKASFVAEESQDIVQVDGPWDGDSNCLDYHYREGFPYIGRCHGRWNQRWTLTASGELRLPGHYCMEYEESSSVVKMVPCTGAANQAWTMRASRQIGPKSSLLASKCLDASASNGKVQLSSCVDTPSQRFISSAFHPESQALIHVQGPWAAGQNCVDYANGKGFAYIHRCHGFPNQLWEYKSKQLRTTDDMCLAYDDGNHQSVSVRKCDLRAQTQRWDYMPRTSELRIEAANNAVPLCLDANKAQGGGLQLHECHGGPNQQFKSSIFPAFDADAYKVLTDAHSALLTSIEAAVDNLSSTGELITMDVLQSAEAFVTAYHQGKTNANVAADTWVAMAKSIVFETGPNHPYSYTDLAQPTQNAKLVAAMTVWPYLSSDELKADKWEAFYSNMDSQLYALHFDSLRRIVYAGHVGTLESYFNGLRNDMNVLLSQVFPRVCAVFASNKMCSMIKYYELVTARIDLQLAISLSNGRVDEYVQDRATAFTQIYSEHFGEAQPKELWHATGLRLLFDSLELQIFPTDALLSTARPENLFLAYVVFANYKAEMAALVPHLTFLVDQVTLAHLNAIKVLVDDRNVPGMADYIDADRQVSDLGILGSEILPQLCSVLPDQSICQLVSFHAALLQVLGLQKSSQSPVVSLTDLAEVDVRKQLDVLDGEYKHFQLINQIQDAANKIGDTIQDESRKIQQVVRTETANIRADIAASTEILYNKMGEEGRALQAQIDQSTQQLENTIGAAAHAIRRDIADNTKLLYEKMDDEARALQHSITENTRKLSRQIGEEARATRGLIEASTNKLYNKIGEEGRAIRTKIDQSTAKLYKKIGDEANSIRHKIDVSTDKLYNKIGEEGRQTRAKIDSSTRQLTGLINESTSKLTTEIRTGTRTTVRAFKKGFKALSDYYKSGATVSAFTLQKTLQLSMGATDGLMKGFEAQLQPFFDEVDAAIENTQEYSWGQAAFIGARIGASTAQAVKAVADCSNFFSWLSGDADPAEAVQHTLDVAERAGEAQSLVEDEREIKAKAKDFNQHSADMKKMSDDFKVMAGQIGDGFSAFQKVANNPDSISEEELDTVINKMMNVYTKFEVPMSQTQISSIEGSMEALMQLLLDSLGRATTGNPNLADAIRHIRAASGMIGPIFAAMSEVYAEMGIQFEKLGEALRSAASLRASNDLSNEIDSIKDPNVRRLQDSSDSDFKPLYSLVFARLSRLQMEYKIQSAALQFCRYYEYRLGGVAPSVCRDTTHSFYSIESIQKMRSYRAPQRKTMTRIAMLPTRPSRLASDNTTLTGPYLDLDVLARGEPAMFHLPVNDRAWLERYNWVLPGSGSSITPTFIKSMQVVLPYTASSPDTMYNRFTATSDVKLGRAHQLGSESGKTYVLPSTTLRFTSAMNERVCAKTTPNPYHQAARCVTEASELCIYDDGTVTRNDALPSLYSRWQVEAPKVRGDGFNLALPVVNAVDAVEMDVMVQLEIVLASDRSSSRSRRSIDEERESVRRASTCCAEDEYFLFNQRKCTKCPAGSTGALQGYSCQRVQ